MNGLCDDGDMHSERPQGVSTPFINKYQVGLASGGPADGLAPFGGGQKDAAKRPHPTVIEIQGSKL